MASESAAVLLTGASKGIGYATAILLDSNGFKVYAGVRREEDAQALREAASNRLTPLMLDVSDGGSIARARRQIAEQTDALAGLVNNAGVVVAGPLEALPMSELRDQFEVNVFGVLALTKAFLPHLRVGRGRIVNVSSINGRIVTPFAAAYGASKFALEGISDGLRMELSPWSIPVSVVQPGATATAIWSTSTQRALDNAGNFDPEMRDRYAGLVAAIERRGGQPPQHAIPPERVAAVIHRALTTRRPRTRYLVGTDARIAAVMAAVLPDRLKDRILTRRSRRRTGADPNDRVETTRPESAP